MRGRVRDERHRTRIGHPVELDAPDGLVGRDMHVGRVGIRLPAGLLRNVIEVRVLRGGGDVDRAELPGFLDRLFRPFPGIDVIREFPAAQQVHGHHAELERRPALQEQHFVVRRDGHELAQVAPRSSRMALTLVRISPPPVDISMISTLSSTSTAPTSLPLRSEVWIAIIPLVPRPCRVYSEMGVRLPNPFSVAVSTVWSSLPATSIAMTRWPSSSSMPRTPRACR